MADIMLTTSTYQTGTLDTATVLINNVSPMNANQPNGLASAIIQIQTILGSGPDLKGSMADLATRLNLQMTAGGILIPPGAILPYGGSVAPNSLWYLAQGALVSRTTDAALFAVYGTTFGVGDGSTTFALPDLRGRAIIGAGNGTYSASFAPGDVNTGTDEITVPANMSLYTGDAVLFTTSSSAPTGLVTNTTYYVIRVSSTVIKLASSVANAMAGTAINLTTQGSGTHTVTVNLSTRLLGSVGGQESHYQDVTELARHQHSITDPGHSHVEQTANSAGGMDTAKRGSGTGAPVENSIPTSIAYDTPNGNLTTQSSTTGISIPFTATPAAMNIMPPWFALHFIIKR